VAAPDDAVSPPVSPVDCIAPVGPVVVEPVPPVADELLLVDEVEPVTLTEVVGADVVDEVDAVDELVVVEEAPVVSVPVPALFFAEQWVSSGRIAVNKAKRVCFGTIGDIASALSEQPQPTASRLRPNHGSLCTNRTESSSWALFFA
jgi:hypothetical protein